LPFNRSDSLVLCRARIIPLKTPLDVQIKVAPKVRVAAVSSQHNLRHHLFDQTVDFRAVDVVVLDKAEVL
jgi:hypothetical protein